MRPRDDLDHGSDAVPLDAGDHARKPVPCGLGDDRTVGLRLPALAEQARDLVDTYKPLAAIGPFHPESAVGLPAPERLDRHPEHLRSLTDPQPGSGWSRFPRHTEEYRSDNGRMSRGSPSRGSNRPQRQLTGSDPCLRGKLAAADGRDERRSVALGLVRVGHGERCDRLIKDAARTDVPGDLGLRRGTSAPRLRPRWSAKAPGLSGGRAFRGSSTLDRRRSAAACRENRVCRTRGEPSRPPAPWLRLRTTERRPGRWPSRRCSFRGEMSYWTVRAPIIPSAA